MLRECFLLVRLFLNGFLLLQVVESVCFMKTSSHCFDHPNHNCLALSRSGLCDTEPVVASEYCQKTCGNCDCLKCIDSKSMCGRLAIGDNNCTNSYVFRRFCPLKCKVCRQRPELVVNHFFGATANSADPNIDDQTLSKFSALERGTEDAMSDIVSSLIRQAFKRSLYTPNGQLAQCDNDADCNSTSTGYSCVYHPIIEGLRSCLKIHDRRPHFGRCPVSSDPIYPLLCNDATTITRPCLLDSDCTETERCCRLQRCYNATLPVCVQALNLPMHPRLTLLANASTVVKSTFDELPTELVVRSTVVLVQSKAKNILWDLGSADQRHMIIRNLRELAGLALSDLHFAIASHGHLDHTAMAPYLPNVPITFGRFTVLSSALSTNDVWTVGPAGMRVFAGDENLQLLETPGHTRDCLSLLIRNVTDAGGSYLGTVALVADLVANAHDAPEDQDQMAWSPEQLRHSRQKVFCRADWIVPGHGSMFIVTPRHRQMAGGCKLGPAPLSRINSSTTMESS